MLIQRLIGVSILAVVGLWGWTQYHAYHYAYHPSLGVPWWTVRHFWTEHSIYAPWQGLIWAWRWGTLSTRLLLAGSVVASILMILGIVWLSRRRQPPALTGYGTGRWAKGQDIRKAGL